MDNLKAILDHFDNPQDKIKSILVGGTNGKGSVSAMISSILGAAGYRVGLNISPHLSNINERIVIDGRPAEEDLMSEAGLQIQSACNALKTNLSFHEAITVCAFLVFERLKLDWQVLEIGLGGRLDAANTVRSPNVSVLVTVDLDHQALLGNTLEKIAMEKMGIFRKEGMAVVGKLNPDLLPYVSEYLSKYTMKSICYGLDYSVINQGGNDAVFKDFAAGAFNFTSGLDGEHQQQNASIAIAACRFLGISNEQCLIGLSNVFWPGRLEPVKYKDTDILLDCGHNPAGIRSLVSYIKSRSITDINLGFGVLGTKQWREMIDLLVPHVKTWNLLTSPTETAVDSSEIADFLSLKGLSCRNYDRNYEQYLSDLLNSGSKSNILTGSIYLIGAVRSLVVKEDKAIWKRIER